MRASFANMLLSLAGRAMCVTGAGSGIGRAVSLSLAEAGASVACLDRDVAAASDTVAAVHALQAAGSHAIAVDCDVSDGAACAAAVQRAVDELPGQLTASVNCAGITVDGFLLKMKEEAFDRVIDVNLKGSFNMTQAAARAIIEQQKLTGEVLGGSVVNISSIVGKMGNMGQTNYAASKAGVIGLSKSAAKELGRSKVRVNAVLPGFINTPMAAAVPDAIADQFKVQIPLGEFGEPEDIAHICTFLVSPKASYITGAAIEVTGGFSM